MTAKILAFKMLRMKGEAPKPKVEPKARFQCTTCKHDHFWITTEEEVWCATCEKAIVNLVARVR